MTQNTSTFLSLPKLIDLHIHLDGAISLSSARELLAINKKRIPDDATLKSLFQVQDPLESLSGFLERFSNIYPLIQTREALTLITRNLLKELSDEGLIYVEIRFAPLLCCRKGLSQEEVLQAVLDGVKDGPIKCNLILCVLREAEEEANIKTIHLAHEYLGKGVVALDIAGAEDRCDDQGLGKLIRLIQEHRLPLTVHAGEASGADNIKRALEWGARVIGHGVRAYEDPAVEDCLAQNRIPLTMCPSSNVLTGVVSQIEDLPIRRYLEKGIPITINTDDPGIEGITLRQEWTKVIQAFHLTKEEIRQIMLNYIDAAFCKEEEKEWLRKEILSAYPI